MSIARQSPTILIFDSGIGGLSVYNEIYKKMPNLHYIYAFDNEMFPYGDKSEQFLIDRVINVIDNISKLYTIDLAVIACNTASTICLPSLRAKFSFPIVGVVPAIKPASQMTKNKCIGLLATKATVQRAYTNNLIKQFAPDCKVELLGLSELAQIAENKLQGMAVNMPQLKQLLQPWLSLSVCPDTIVLGCTHYPFIKEELQVIFPHATFIDSGNAIAMRVYELLHEKGKLIDSNLSLNEENIIVSTALNQYVEKLTSKLAQYNLQRYQCINVLSV
ncbi:MULTISPECIES: glutamate racemase [unclassified Gilliamella]|uniref:glutamate racemase n=1 Tax=unclassified Gilliamella TaxID=2685620 RepID=UPI00226A827F|nr:MULTISPECIES: glutamate racemase [unclassified Gilliamella]MCX8642877.1 glutamate racemase [Gilliamella sp. B3835]MCX8708164.1 glutamate racemase [Gilliamella sp. B3783]MCX8710062.1 glutamate racemase [Gilliamella sp. B3780]MCX8715338.1 glutamate racemase [Gilliamella sp. B3781]MCX8717359.1 glutamate racemase [Gilliamella sp. B3784]